jgi:aminomethyltransferase
LQDPSAAEQAPGENQVPYLLVVNASNRQKILDWIAAHLPPSGVVCCDETFSTAMIAVQGPAARKLVMDVLHPGLNAMRYYYGKSVGHGGELSVVSRTGYTGEDGFELIVPAAGAADLWEKLLTAGQSVGAVPVGLGARDTLRLEAAMPLYGHELSESIDPFTSGLDFAVNLEGRNFPGRDALAQIASRPRQRVRVGLELACKRVPREGYGIRRSSKASDDNVIGEISSGTFSPTLKRPIAMGYVRAEFSQPGTELTIDIRGQLEPARVVPLPFYRRPKTN